jgi:hypothetical protein
MNVQYECIASMCAELRLPAVADNYPAVAQGAVEAGRSFADFLDPCSAQRRLLDTDEPERP